MVLESTKEGCVETNRGKASPWHLHVGTENWFFSIRSCSSVSSTYYKPSSICQKNVLQFPSQRFCQVLIMLQPVLCLSGSKSSLEVGSTAQ